MVFLIPKTSGKCLAYTAYFFFLMLMVFIPIASIIHYVINWNMIYEDGLNKIRAWQAVYPLMGAMNFILYYLVRNFIYALKSINE